jgi:hypothetical protein
MTDEDRSTAPEFMFLAFKRIAKTESPELALN